MVLGSKYSLIVAILVSAVLFSCSSTKYVKDGEYLLKSVKVKLDNNKVDKERFTVLNKQKPNRRILWSWKFHLWAYNRYKEDNNSKMKKWISEKPVIYDSNLVKPTISQMEIALKNMGYYEGNIEVEKKFKKKKVKLIYSIETGVAYHIRNVVYNIKDDFINNYIRGDSANSLLKEGQTFNLELMENERARITRELKNYGYYFFSKNYVFYEADSTVGNRQVDLYLGIQNLTKPVSSKDSTLVEYPHQRYYIKGVSVNIDNDNKKNDEDVMDTTEYNRTKFYQSNEYYYKPKALERAMFMDIEGYYLLKDQELTYRRLSSLRNFKYINIAFEEVPGLDKNYLDCHIDLIPVPLKSFTVETNLKTSSGNNGAELSFGYQDINFFRGAEIFNLRLTGGLEVQQLITKDDNKKVIEELPFNTIEFGPEASIIFPRFLLPFNSGGFSKNNNPKTVLSIAYNFQQRPDYKRNLSNVSFAYSWFESKNKQHIIKPIDINFIRLNKSADFEQLLESSDNSLLINSYTDHFIMASSYSFIYNTQNFKKRENFMFYRGNLEFAGNSLSGWSKLFNAPQDETGSYEAFNVRFAQYVRVDMEYKYYFVYEKSALVLRTVIGVGKPYGNLDVLPFEKSFFMGGSNDLRAWRTRDLGPGSLSKTLTEEDNIDQIGEVKWEGNIEYRFDLSKILEFALFSDFGNIWLLKEDEKRPNAELDFSRLWTDLAIGTGLGLRLDFNFFLIRFDMATRIKDPGSEKPDEVKFDLSNSPILNFGIGYPF